MTIYCEVLKEDVDETPVMRILKNNKTIANLKIDTMSDRYQMKTNEFLTSDTTFTCGARNQYELYLTAQHSETILFFG